MAKSRRNRAARRKDPIAKTVKPPSDPELAALRTSKVLPVVTDLQSADPKLRSSAAAAVANIIQDSRCRKLLLREQIVHIVLTQTLTDAALESRAAGWGILQTLAAAEEADFCVHLFRQDVLTAAEFAAKMIAEKIRSRDPEFTKLPELERATLASMSDSIVTLLTALAEAQDDILEAIAANSSIITLLTTLVTQETATQSDAISCLTILSEDNPKLSRALMDSECLDALLKLKVQPTIQGVTACGLLHNMSASLRDASVDTSSFDDWTLVETLSQVLAAAEQAPGPAAEAVEILASIGTDLNSAAAQEQKPKSGRHSQKQETDAVDDEDMGDAEAEGASDAEPEVAEGADEEDEEMDEDEMEADMDMVTGADEPDSQGANIDDIPTLKALLQHALPQLINLATLQASNGEAIHLQGLALSALSNTAWSVSLVDFSDPHNSSIRKAWTPVATAIWAKVISPILASDTADIALATQVTSLAWAVARTLHGGEAPLKTNEHRKFVALYQATKGSGHLTSPQHEDDPFQGLGVKCIGVLGQLALHPAPVNLNREIGMFLVTAVASLPDTPAADAVEAMNQLFDVYADEAFPYDKQVFWADGFLKHLEDAVPKAKAMLKTIDKRAQPELRARADEAVLNLSRFLGYKRKHQPK